MQKQYKRFICLTISNVAVQDLFVENVLTHEQKLEIQKIDAQKRMEYLLDYVIFRSLHAEIPQKYISLINIMIKSDDSLLRAMASEMIKLYK